MKRLSEQSSRKHITVLSLFSGIGLFDLGVLAALEERGFDARVAAQVEIDPFCRKVLERHYPNTSREIEDVREVREWNTPWTDVIIGGFPCQDVSSAGRRVGMRGARSGLWWAFRDVIRTMRPRAVLVENVASGLRDWHGPVRCSLQAMGYRTVATQISAASVGAPHLRKRVFVLAYPNGKRLARPGADGEIAGGSESGHSGAVADAYCGGQQCCAELDSDKTEVPADWYPRGRHVDGSGRSTLGDAYGMGRERLDTESGLRGNEPKASGRILFESRMDRAINGSAPKLDAHQWPAGRNQEQFAWEAPRTFDGQQQWRRQRLKSLGNAPTPQQALAAMRWAIDLLGWKP